jgi:hypothetical protein
MLITILHSLANKNQSILLLHLQEVV